MSASFLPRLRWSVFAYALLAFFCQICRFLLVLKFTWKPPKQVSIFPAGNIQTYLVAAGPGPGPLAGLGWLLRVLLFAFDTRCWN